LGDPRVLLFGSDLVRGLEKEESGVRGGTWQASGAARARIRWRGRSRSMNQPSREINERLRKMNDRASNLDKRLSCQAEESKGWHARWDDPPRLG